MCSHWHQCILSPKNRELKVGVTLLRISSNWSMSGVFLSGGASLSGVGSVRRWGFSVRRWGSLSGDGVSVRRWGSLSGDGGLCQQMRGPLSRDEGLCQEMRGSLAEIGWSLSGDGGLFQEEASVRRGSLWRGCLCEMGSLKGDRDPTSNDI